MSAAISFPPDRATYIRSHAWMAAIAMAGAMLILWLVGNPHVWTGAIAGLAAITVRGWYLASEELASVWRIEGAHLIAPSGIEVALGDIDTLRAMAGYVQVVTRGGNKHLIKYQPDPAATIAAIERARP